jgi:hypothetical protein
MHQPAGSAAPSMPNEKPVSSVNMLHPLLLLLRSVVKCFTSYRDCRKSQSAWKSKSTGFPYVGSHLEIIDLEVISI